MISLTSLLQGNIMGIFKFLDAVRIWWNNQYSILRKSSTTVLLYHSWYALVHTQYRPGMYEYVPSTYWYVMLKMVHTSMYWYVLSMYRYYDMYDCHEVWHCFSF